MLPGEMLHIDAPLAFGLSPRKISMSRTVGKADGKVGGVPEAYHGMSTPLEGGIGANFRGGHFAVMEQA